MNTSKKQTGFRFFQLFTAVLDAAVFYFSIYAAAFIRSFFEGGIGTQNISSIEIVLPFVCLTGIGLMYVFGIYGMRERSRFDVLYSVLSTVFFLALVTMALSFFLQASAFPRSIAPIAAGIQFVTLTAWHFIALKIGQALHGRQAVLIVGHGAEMQMFAQKIVLSQGRLFDINHFFDLDREQYKDMRRHINNAEHVFICPDVTQKERHKIFSYCMAQDTGIFLIPDLFDISVKNAKLQTFDDAPVFRIGQLSLTWEQRVLKRLFDLVFSVIFVIIASPVMAVCALVIKLTSEGPVIFKQERITEGNRVFNVYKFRTMYVNAESQTGPVFALEKDTRVTKAGAFFRATRLDELPQFFNVIKGEMSVVGPRPERPFFISQFKTELPDYDYRAAVKAGITGYAQVMGKYTTTASDKLRFDLWYIKNYSLWMDITLIIKTVRMLFIREASKGVAAAGSNESDGKSGSSIRRIRFQAPRK